MTGSLTRSDPAKDPLAFERCHLHDCRIDDDAVCGLLEISEDMRAYSTRAAWPC
jgi:hypothetical protein